MIEEFEPEGSATKYRKVWETLRACDAEVAKRAKEAPGGNGGWYLPWAAAWGIFKSCFPHSGWHPAVPKGGRDGSVVFERFPAGVDAWAAHLAHGAFAEAKAKKGKGSFLRRDEKRAITAKITADLVANGTPPGETALVGATVWCVADGQTVEATAYLPVYGVGNNAHPCPGPGEINNALQRCRVKALADLGLGLEMWTGEGHTVDYINTDDASRKAAERLRARLEAKPAAPAAAQGAAEAPGGKAEDNPKGARRADLIGRYAHIAGPLAAVGIDPTNPAALASLRERAEEDGGREVEVYCRAADSGEHPCDVVRGMCNPAYVQAVAACESAGQEFEPPPELSNVRPSLEDCDDFFAMLGAVVALEAIAEEAKK